MRKIQMTNAILVCSSTLDVVTDGASITTPAGKTVTVILDESEAKRSLVRVYNHTKGTEYPKSTYTAESLGLEWSAA